MRIRLASNPRLPRCTQVEGLRLFRLRGQLADHQVALGVVAAGTARPDCPVVIREELKRGGCRVRPSPRCRWQTRLVTELKIADSISVAVTASELYALVSDVTRMGEWSPICRACWWDEGAGPRVGAWFTGRNETHERTWETRCQVVAATPGREFAWEVNNGWVYWGYTFEPENGGTGLTESWKFLPAGIAGFRERFGTQADAEIDKRRLAAKTGIPATLAAIKKGGRSRRLADDNQSN